MPPAVALRGQRELLAALSKADKQTRLGVRKELVDVAQPVSREATSLAMSTIRRMSRSPQWAAMRVGITQKLVYVAPKKRGIKSRGYDPRKRGDDTGPPSFPSLLMGRAMEPALHRHEHDLENRLGIFLERIADDFNHGGPIA